MAVQSLAPPERGPTNFVLSRTVSKGEIQGWLKTRKAPKPEQRAALNTRMSSVTQFAVEQPNF